MTIRNFNTFNRSVLIAVLFLTISVSSPALGQDDSGPYTLRWNPETGRVYTYMFSTSGSIGDNISVATENFTIQIDDAGDGLLQMRANGDSIPDSARLGLRFQRTYWPEFTFTVDSLGNYEAPAGQPFPVFLNIPILPDGAVSEGFSWSGGPVGILPDPNVGTIPFTFESTISSIADYQGDMCALIVSDYSVSLDDDAQSFIPFMGLVEGDPPGDNEQAGQGAPVSGVVEGSRADQAGILPGDFITAAEGQRIRSWGGLEEILPQLVPDKPVDFLVRRGEDEFSVEIAPEGVPLAWISASGGLSSTCYFSIERGIPLKIDLVSNDLVFTLTNPEGEEVQREADIHIVMEYQYGGR